MSKPTLSRFLFSNKRTSPNGQNKALIPMSVSKDSFTSLKTCEATSLIATFVGAQVRVLYPILRRVKSRVPVVFVLPVPGGPHISSTDNLWLQSILRRQARTALFWDSFSFEVILVVNFSSQLPSLCAEQRSQSSSFCCST